MNSKLDNQKVSFVFCDFNNESHCKKLVDLIEHYMLDPMGNNKSLTQVEKLNLVVGLSIHPSSFVLFITLESEIVGLATCFINFSTFKARQYLNIHDIVLLKTHRGKGLGRKLIEECIDIAQKREYCKVTLEVRDDNANAKNLYKSLDFKDSDPLMHFWTKTLSQ